jgi:AraC-like DNA-binding protein
MDRVKTINYSDIFLSFASEDVQKCTHMVKDHVLVYVLSGELEMTEQGVITIIHKGKCAFIRKNNRLTMTPKPKDDEQVKAVYLCFKRDFLRRFYQTIDRKNLPTHLKRGELNVCEMPERPDITSLFLSITPYFDTSMQPTEDWMKLKLQEGLMVLLKTDDRFYPCLFDFSEPWKIDIFDYLNDNYMYDLSVEEIANFTGRSLASFKRDFSKISNLSPQKWLINKRLEAARWKIQNEKKRVSDVYLEVGFKSLSHFSRAYKDTFGYPPTQK